ncbi:hypothetical protein BC826DRAFT_1040267 [Russula brevipes]|nr:hypothetical protein BC826DRAFT_1040267 [Russula brevipes]
MRLRQDPPSVTQSQSRSRKRKTPPSAESLQPVPPPPPAAMQHTLPPAHTLVPPPHLSGHILHPPSYQYPPAIILRPAFPHHIPWAPRLLLSLPKTSALNLSPPMALQIQRQREHPAHSARVNVPSRIARHNARSVNVGTSASYHSFPFFRVSDVRFQPPPYRHVKALESRSQLLDAALASADEANRRWEECRALVDQLRIENAALRAALSQTQMLSSGGSTVQPPGGNDESNSRVAEGTKGAEEPKE